MRILVVSDTHGDMHTLRRVVMSQPTAEVVVHCGDGAAEANELKSLFPEKMIVSVRGNCDFCCTAPLKEVFTIESKKLFITHGHLYGVKGGLYTLSCAASEEGADIVLFGHTHIPTEVYDDGLYMLNPGSLRGYEASYGYVDITPQGIVTNTVPVSR